jgi:hypothetical protein
MLSDWEAYDSVRCLDCARRERGSGEMMQPGVSYVWLVGATSLSMDVEDSSPLN